MSTSDLKCDNWDGVVPHATFRSDQALSDEEVFSPSPFQQQKSKDDKTPTDWCMDLSQSSSESQARTHAVPIPTTHSMDTPDLSSHTLPFVTPTAVMTPVALVLSNVSAFVKSNTEKFKAQTQKQNCHFCGRNRVLEARIICNNVFCSLQGHRTKFMCEICWVAQDKYFKAHDLDIINIFGDRNDPNWFCPGCVLWEDGTFPYPGICCCSFRRNGLECPLHTSDARLHCKPYRQKTGATQKLTTCPLSPSIIFAGTQSFSRRVQCDEAEHMENSTK